MNITEEQRTEIKQALALMNSMLRSGEQHSNKSTEVFNKALATVNKLPIQNVSGSAIANKCNDCGKIDESVKTRPSGYGLQCYECYKFDKDHDSGNW